MWALPTTLRVVLIENLRRLAERVATNKAAREVANLCCDNIDSYTTGTLDELLACSTGAAWAGLSGAMAQRLNDLRPVDAPAEQDGFQDWLRDALPDLAAAQTAAGRRPGR